MAERAPRAPDGADKKTVKKDVGGGGSSDTPKGRLKRRELKYGDVHIIEDFESSDAASPAATEAKTEGATDTSADAGKSKPAAVAAETSGVPAVHKPESAEAGKELVAPGAAVVEAVKHHPETPLEVKKALDNPENAKAAAEAVDNKTIAGSKMSVFWGAVRPALVGIATGMAARAFVRFFAKRALDMSTVGAGMVAGGAFGAGSELWASYRAESKRLYDIKTYNDAMADYGSMTDLEKAQALVALQEALKDNIQKSELSVEQRVLYSSKLKYLREELETLGKKDLTKDRDEAKIKALLEYHAPPERKKLSREEINKLIDTDAEFKAEWEKKGLFEKLYTYATGAAKQEKRDLLSKQSKEVKAALEQFYKERKLKRNWARIGAHTLKGAAIGVAGGALGAYAFDRWINPHLGSYAAPDIARANAPGLNSPLGGGDALRTAAGHGGDMIIHTPSGEDLQKMHGSVWQTVKEYMVSHGVTNPSNADINAGMLEIAKANGVEISGHHLADPNHAGHLDDAVKRFLDTKMQPNTDLHGFDSLKGIIEKAGGHVAGSQEIIVHSPGESGVQAAKDWMKTHTTEQVIKELETQQRNLKTAVWLVGVTALGTGLWRWGRKGKKEGPMPGPEPAKGPVLIPETGLRGGDLRDKNLEQRLAVLEQIKTEALERIKRGTEYLSGENPNLEAYQEEWRQLDILLGDEQFEHLTEGASEEDREKIGSAWNEMIEVLNAAAKPTEDRAAKLLEQRNQAAAEEESAVDDGGEDGDIDDESNTQKATADARTKKVVEITEAPVKKAVAEVEIAITDGDKALKKGRIDQAQAHLEKAAAALAALVRAPVSLVREGIGRLIRRFEPKIESLRLGIEAEKQKAGGVQPENPNPPAQGERATEAAKLGLEPWQVKRYKQMVDLGLMTPLAEGERFEPGSGNLHRLNQFAIFTKEGGGPFVKLTSGGAKDLQKGFLNALTKLKEGKSAVLKEYCLKILSKGNQLKKDSQASNILDEMRQISTEVGKVVDQARIEFRPVKKIAKRK